MHIGTPSVRVLEARMHQAAWALQVGEIAALLIAIRYRKERPPSDDAQHLPSILLAEAVVKSDDKARPETASIRITGNSFMVDTSLN
jgi:hypothetical protein